MPCCSRSLSRSAPRDRTTARGSSVINTANTRYRRGWPCSRTTHQRARDPRAAVLETPRVRKSAKDLRVVREDRAKAAAQILGGELRADTWCLGLHQEQEPFNIIGQRRDSGQAVDPHMHGLVKVEVDVEIDEWIFSTSVLVTLTARPAARSATPICAGTRRREHGHRFACPSFARRGSIRGFHAMVQGRVAWSTRRPPFRQKKAKLLPSRFRSVDQ